MPALSARGEAVCMRVCLMQDRTKGEGLGRRWGVGLVSREEGLIIQACSTLSFVFPPQALYPNNLWLLVNKLTGAFCEGRGRDEGSFQLVSPKVPVLGPVKRLPSHFSNIQQM